MANEEDECQYELDLTEEDLGGIGWLLRTLESIQKKGPEHRSYRQAKACAQALTKIREHCNNMHAAAHFLEHRNKCVGVELAEIKMFLQDWGEA